MIIYNGNELVLHKVAGESNFTLITFMGVNYHDRAMNLFFLEKLSKKYKFNCYGITTKKPNWYISSEIDEIARIIELDGDYNIRILAGPSMGGFAAIKFSRLFKADIVFAMAPQYTIDPDIESKFNNYSQFYNDSMSNMTISNNDLRGKIFIAVDPYDKIDYYHSKKILDLSDSGFEINIIPVFYAEHIVYNDISGSDSFKEIILALSTMDNSKINLSVSKSRRRNNYNLIKRLNLYNKNLYLQSLSLLSDKIHNKERIYANHSYILKKIHGLCLLKRYDLALRMKNKLFYNFLYYKIPQNMGFKNFPRLIIDCHGKVICFNHKCECLESREFGDQKHLSPLSLYSIGNKNYLFFWFEDERVFLYVNERKSLSFSSEINMSSLCLNIDNSLIFTSYGYLRSNFDGSVFLFSENKLEWEKFVFV
ncbi:hypothetical protein E3E11_02695 [Oecophyllibacter saccharovorans]|uniref:hypothetical protein n=1 Tax=Oecophyllibacter saccharovorans TaxID=2558360 RepID=UPI001141A21A|nr:hypothetical protein [Oecophyllibacter saccharovorans]QDH14949.1 hypothetical protein E3E11_02695 [Oecophyllibacter saccharovorans]